MSGSLILAHIICDTLIESNSQQLNLIVCGTDNEELVSTLNPEEHSEHNIRKNSCYFADIVHACQTTYAGILLFETLPGQRGRARLVCL